MISFGRVPVLALAFFCSSVGPWHHVVGVAAVQAIWKEMENWLLQCCNSFLFFRFFRKWKSEIKQPWHNGMVLFPQKTSGKVSWIVFSKYYYIPYSFGWIEWILWKRGWFLCPQRDGILERKFKTPCPNPIKTQKTLMWKITRDIRKKG